MDPHLCHCLDRLQASLQRDASVLCESTRFGELEPKISQCVTLNVSVYEKKKGGGVYLD